MPPIMTDAHKTLLTEAKQQMSAAKQATRKKRIVYGKYEIFKFDECNWAVQDSTKSGEPGYFPNVAGCLRYVYHQLIGDNIKHDQLENIVTVIYEVETNLMTAIQNPVIMENYNTSGALQSSVDDFTSSTE